MKLSWIDFHGFDKTNTLLDKNQRLQLNEACQAIVFNYSSSYQKFENDLIRKLVVKLVPDIEAEEPRIFDGIGCVYVSFDAEHFIFSSKHLSGIRTTRHKYSCHYA